MIVPPHTFVDVVMQVLPMDPAFPGEEVLEDASEAIECLSVHVTSDVPTTSVIDRLMPVALTRERLVRRGLVRADTRTSHHTRTYMR